MSRRFVNDAHAEFDGCSILVVGGDHYNTLAAVRCLGRERIPFDLFLHGEGTYGKSRIAKSKYAPSSGRIVADSEDELLGAIEKWASTKVGDVLIAYPCSDLAERVIEECLPGSVHPKFTKGSFTALELMDKHAQAKWAREHGFHVATDGIVALDGGGEPSDIFRKFGKCIFKPVESALGAKSDIRIAKTVEEIADCLSFYRSCGYKTILVQQFIEFDYELVANGCILKSGEIIWHLIKKIQIHPKKGGSLAYGVLESDPSICDQAHTFIQKLADEAYCGTFDIEFFVQNGIVSLNECNFRQSGPAFSLINRGVPFPAIWIKDAMGISYDCGSYHNLNQSDNERFAHERFLIASAVRGEESYATVMRRLFGATQYGYWARDDIRGSLAWYR